MKNLSLLLLVAFLFASCAPAATALPTSTPKPTQTATLTSTHTLTPTSTLTPTITPTPLPITFIYQDNVPANGRTLQEQGAYKAYAYYSQYADLGPITVYTFEDINKYIDQIFPALHADVPTLTKSGFVQEWTVGGGGNTGAQDIVVIGSSALGWNDEGNHCYIAKNVAHELFHTLQSRLMHHGLFRPELDYGPEWLKEGSAEYFGNHVANGINGCSYQQLLDGWIQDSGDKTFSLHQVEGENFNAKVGFWSVAPLAVDQLINSSANGEKSVIDYFSAIGSGIRWQDAFTQAFGRTVEDFYTEFGAYREKINVTLDASVCLPQSSSRIKCLGRKPNKTNGYTYVFNLPFGIQTEPQQWQVDSNCAVVGYSANGSNAASNLMIDVDANAQGTCHIEFTFTADRQAAVDFKIPVDASVTLTPLVTVKGKVITTDASQKFKNYVVSFCNLKIEQCLPGVLIADDGSFVTYREPGEYKISVNPMNGGEALGWYSEKGLVSDIRCSDVFTVLEGQETEITIDLHLISASCN